MKEKEHASKLVSLYVRKANAFLEYLLAPSADILLAGWCYAAIPKCKDDATEHASSFSCFYIVRERRKRCSASQPTVPVTPRKSQIKKVQHMQLFLNIHFRLTKQEILKM